MEKYKITFKRVLAAAAETRDDTLNRNMNAHTHARNAHLLSTRHRNTRSKLQCDNI